MENPLRRRLQAPEGTLGMWVTLECPSVTEIAVILGLDWVCVDMEHGHLDLREVMEHLRTVRGSHTAILVRVPEIQGGIIKRVLDMGAHGVLLPMVRDREDLEAGVRLARYPPMGTRGVGGERAVRWGLSFARYLNHANEETLVIPLIETREAIANIESILRVPGLEVIFFGPADLSASYGYLGQWEGPGVAEQILAVCQKADAQGIAAGIISRTAEEAAQRQAQGFRLVGLGSDTGLLIRAITETMSRLGRPSSWHLSS